MSRRQPFPVGLSTVLAFLLVIVGLGVFGMDTAFAQAPAATDPVPSILSFYTFIVGHLITVLNFLAWYLFMLLDLVMDTAWIFNLTSAGSDGSLVNMLREIWQLCRDLVNVFLAILLVYEAIMMIIKADGSKLKEMLPKFVLTVVAVNFSWFIPRAIFDFSQVITYTAYQIPTMIGEDGCTVTAGGGEAAKPCEIATQFLFFNETNRLAKVGADEFRDTDGSTGWRCPIPGLLCIQFIPYNEAGERPMRTRILNGLIVNYGRLRNLIYITDPRPAGGGPIGENVLQELQRSGAYMIKLVIVLILHIAIVFPLMAMVAAFFIRIPVLWVTMAAMPLVALGFLIGDKLGDFNPMKAIWEQFLSAVFLPAKIALPFAVSFIMLNAASTAAPPSGPAFENLARPIAVFTDIKDSWQMLWMIVALFILWKYSFMVLKKDEIMGQFTDRIEGMGKSLGGIAAKIPMSLPIIPGPQGQATTLGRVRRAFDLREIDAGLRGGNTLKEVFADRATIMGGNQSNIQQQQVKAAREIINNTTNNNNVHTTIQEQVTNIGDLRNADANNAVRMRGITELLRNIRASAGGAQFSRLTNHALLEAMLDAEVDARRLTREQRNKLVETFEHDGGALKTQNTVPAAPAAPPPAAP